MALAEVCPQYAACPGGEDAVLKTVDPKGFAGSNPVCSADSKWIYSLAIFLFTNRVALDYRGAEDRNHRNMKLKLYFEFF